MDRTYAEIVWAAEEHRRALLADGARTRRAAAPDPALDRPGRPLATVARLNLPADGVLRSSTGAVAGQRLAAAHPRRHRFAPRRSLAAVCYRLAAWLDARYVAAQGTAPAHRARFDPA